MNETQRTDETLHVVLDLETASTESNAAVLSIGAIGFILDSQSLKYEEFYDHLSLEHCENRGLHIDPRTIEWWKDQSVEMRDEAFKGAKYGNSLAVLYDFVDWYRNLQEKYKRVRLWGNGANFDPVVLGNCLDTFDVKIPWIYRDVRCLRTLLKLLPPAQKVHQPDSLKHHALWDARYEATNLKHCLKFLKHCGVNVDEL